MLEQLFTLTNENNSLKELSLSIRRGVPSAVFGVSENLKSYIIAGQESKVLLVVKDLITARSFAREIKQFSNKNVVVVPEKDETLFISRAFSKDGVFERLNALYNLKNADVIIGTACAFMQIFPKSIESLTVKKDGDYDFKEFSATLVKMGYKRVEETSAKGTFCIRGDIIDVFPINSDNPYRIDFFGDTCESIKEYDLDLRKSIGYSNSIDILQTAEFTFSNDDKRYFKTMLLNELHNAKDSRKQRLQTVCDDLLNALDNGDLDITSALAPLSSDCTDVFGLIDKDTVIFIDEAKRVNEISSLLTTEFTERFDTLYSGGEVFSFANKNFMGVQAFTEKISGHRLVAIQTLSTAVPFFNPLKLITLESSNAPDYHYDFKEIYSDILSWKNKGYSVVLCTGDKKKTERLVYDISLAGIKTPVSQNKLGDISVFDDVLDGGFIFPESKVAVVGSLNLFGKSISEKRRTLKKQGFFQAPETGDYCVHEQFGVGRVLGNKRISSTEGTKDYISVEYYGGDILYIPVEQMDILTRYLGSEKKPKLSKIGAKDFERIKNNARESIKKMSFDLKNLYKEREQLKGYKFTEFTELQQEFENAFPFEETVDQKTCDADIKQDMCAGKVMDRLICGDVGFGKTEVAFRAVFRAVANGKQVAMLAPTTILCEQHYNTALTRFKDFGINVASLNRFKSTKEQKAVIDGLKDGSIDFVIGTHRLLSNDVEFKDLGLLVLDEEQRFGVEHKEKIKTLKTNVDVLTLTATPIPRTLHMSLSGIRSISTINTPPKKRLPVQIYVTEQTDTVIIDAITREVNRGGQAFILYNRVESIYEFSEYIRALLPNVKITVAHGQMDEKVMENNIMSFYRGDTDLLISTTIIENGIDLPRANTLVVIDADLLGLSTLYQLKGRVGRSDRLAYAYFTFRREKILTDTAFDRLNAIAEFAEMGSGIKVAMRDLEIRGAGNVLGAEQHGHMDKIGYELYSKLLKEELTGEVVNAPELDVRVSAYIPEDYIMGSSARMDTYKEIAELTGENQAKELAEGLVDAYGEIPQEVENLINIALAKHYASKCGVNKITVTKSQVSIDFVNLKALGEQKLVRAIEKYGNSVKLTMTVVPSLCFIQDGKNSDLMLKTVKDFLLYADNA